MPRRGLNRWEVVNAAATLIEEVGYHNFSMRELADRLHIKTASLYNHVENMDMLYTEIGYYAISRLKQAQLAAIEGKRTDEAVKALAAAYYTFAAEHAELYKVIMSVPMAKSEALLNAAGDIVEPIMRVLNEYTLTEEEKMHLQRVLRSIMHGFISQEEAGCFRHFPVAAAESFQLAVDLFLSGVHKMKGARRNENGYPFNLALTTDIVEL